MDVVEFIAARLSEDEAAALRLLSDPLVSESAQWYERRLLRECEAKRRLLGIIESARQAGLAILLSSTDDDPWLPELINWTTQSLHALAVPYADHPEFQTAWRLPE
ncbi:DUF6221 family protein [Arthrobacter oryzae]|uniref:Uncharacterized protein n=1 Tax=Arthrobacter oryzae TaxID=409290 RepID=A0A3N0BUX2_9MICC|nr:DUF6221 family protein [Arthrobacter oryzae]RNL53200.1 hypothetical protein D7003_13010 [Arthrobacter oryzae]